MPTKTVVDCSTGIQSVVEMTDEEVAAHEAMSEASEALRAEQEAAAAKKVVDKASGEAKLAELGLTADEIAALVG